MPHAVRFTVPGDPVGKGRARARRTPGGVAHYTPRKTAGYQRLVLMSWRLAAGAREPWGELVSVEIDAYVAAPKSWPKWKRDIGCLPRGRKPDIDNIAKSVLDALSKAAWRDDAQVWSMAVRKHTALVPRVEVTVVFEAERKREWLATEG